MVARSLLTAQDCSGQVHLVLGSGPVSASRCARSLEAGARPIVISPPDSESHYTLAKLIEEDKVQWIQKTFEDDDLKTLGRHEVDNIVDVVFVTLGSTHPLSTRVSTLCRRLRIPVNVTDAPNLCTFSLLSTHCDGPLQIGITTSGRGCKLSSRIRREIAASLPQNFGQAIERLGTIRRKIWEEDHAAEVADAAEVEDEDVANQKHTFNTLIPASDTDPAITRSRRMRWLSQICEYWPLRRLAGITDADVSAILSAYAANSNSSPLSSGLPRTRGSITLAGSGPGHPSLLTLATHRAIKAADFILADKLVPAPILDLIPRRTSVYIARKFPGNAEAAQEELLRLGLEAANQGKHVLRLKQGDPYLYGRGAEEVIFFRQHGYESTVLPGITSAMSAPLFAGIPVTHRAVSDQVMVCTGTGRKGASPNPPPYSKNTTFVFLMALHRLGSLVGSLTQQLQSDEEFETQKTYNAWPKDTPCAVIERASCPDQRVIRSTLEHVCAAVEAEGSRPPGLLVLGWSCGVLYKSGGQRWVTEEGFRGLDDIGSEEEGLQALKEMGEHGAHDRVVFAGKVQIPAF